MTGKQTEEALNRLRMLLIISEFRLLEKMFHLFVFCSLCFWHLVVFADSDAAKSVSVTEGGSVSLESGVTEIQTNDLITWTFGHPETRIARISKEDGIFSTSDGDAVGFRDRLQLDHQTGSLTITNTRTTDSGLYTVNIKGTKLTTYRFRVTVYARLPVPVISSSEPLIVLTSAAAAVSLLLLAAVGIFCIYKRHRKTDQEGKSFLLLTRL
ncbi:uncharacterized protein [Sinocyclocheilus grahami]|uniref:uncharacterized protein n=1 Tax=Sinocyclocheilus grahami TaxID=75366 RepID=UPI0007AD4F95|nr:PREDICTED: uncharacterized protein LOC107574767 [Sinocyclocheilus grahami]